jgi:uncharacterized protein (DUF305 family)
MNNYIQKTFVSVMIGLLLFLGMNVQAASSQNEAAYLKRYEAIMKTMKTEMEQAPKTGDPALNYLYQMIPHHEAAVQMAQNLLQYGTNQRIKQIAQKTIKEQTDEIAKMKELIEKIKRNPQVNEAQEAAYMNEFRQAYNAMVDAMDKVKPMGNVDKDFLQEMMPHHDGAISISRAILKYTNNQEVKSMAQNTIKKQTADRKVINKLMSQIN